MMYVGVKDGRVVVANADSVDEAYLAIGKVLGVEVDDPGNVDLDSFQKVPVLRPGEAAELLWDDSR